MTYSEDKLQTLRHQLEIIRRLTDLLPSANTRISIVERPHENLLYRRLSFFVDAHGRLKNIDTELAIVLDLPTPDDGKPGLLFTHDFVSSVGLHEMFRGLSFILTGGWLGYNEVWL